MAGKDYEFWECLVFSDNRSDMRLGFICPASEVAGNIDSLMSIPGVTGVSYENFKDTGNGYRLLNEYELEQWTRGRN